MKNKVLFIKNANILLKNIKNNIILSNICKKYTIEYYKGD